MSSSILDPEDMQHFDIDKTAEEEIFFDEDDLPTKRQVLLSLATIVLFFVGFIIAPTPIDSGTYDIDLVYEDNKISFTIIINDEVTRRGNEIVESAENSLGVLTAKYYTVYPGDAGSSLRFELTVNYTNTIKLSINSFEGKIYDNDLSHKFISHEIIDNTAIFEFKILKDTGVALGLLLAIAFLWLTELVPLAAASLLIPVLLVLWDVDTATGSLSQFSQPIIFLFLAGFLMAEAMKRTGLDVFISYKIFSMVPPNGKFLMFSLMSLSAVFSMFMSNTASTAILIPITLQLLKGIKIESIQFKKAVILGIAYSATIGGIGSLIGTPANIIAVTLLTQFDPSLEISFIEWFYFGIPVVIIMLPITFFYLWARFKPDIDPKRLLEAKTFAKIKLEEEFHLTFDQIVVSVIFVLTFILWMTTSIHGISASIVALIAAILLFFTGQIKESDLQNINWNALITFGGGLTLGAVIINSGLADFIGSQATIISDLPTVLIIFSIGLITVTLTAFASNTASAVILIPIVMPLGYVLGLNPILLALIVAISASMDFAVVIGTPPTMIAYSTKLYKTEEIFKIGIFLDVIGLLVVTLLSWLLFGYFVGFV